jgi:hypothetical protein
MELMIEVDKDYYEILKYNVEHGAKYKPFEIIANGIPLDEDICKEFLYKRNMAVIPGETLVALQLACGKTRPQGEWIPIKSLMEDNYHSRISFRCNQCRYVEGYRSKYCAGCGAFMRVEDGGKNAGVL